MSDRSSLLILNHTPQDECSLEKLNYKLWNSVRRINTKLVVWHTLRDQIFHRNKMNARGSIRKAPNDITWAISLNKLSQVGDKDAGVIIKAWNLMASGQQKLVGGKAQALKTVLDMMPQEVFTQIVVPTVSEMGWEKCPWSDDAFGNKRIYLGNSPAGRALSVAWRERLKVSSVSMRIMLSCQVDKHKKLTQTCSSRKLSKSTMEHDADQAALVHSLVREVHAIVPITDDILKEHYVRLYIDNDPQVHLEVPSVLASRGG